MRALPTISERSARFLIGLLLAIKLLLLAWNAIVYDGRTYDAAHHADRAVIGGLRPGTYDYDPPLYYLPALLVPKPADVARVERDRTDDAGKIGKRVKTPRAEQAFRDRTLDLLRYTNVLWIAFFYLAWIGFAFPRLLRDRQAWFLASLLLLAIPGYQKLAAMSHPDNAFAGISALVVCGWLWLRERWLAGTAGLDAARALGRGGRWLPWLALAIGFVGLTRPLAIAHVAVFTVLALVYAARIGSGQWRKVLPQALLVVAVVGVMSSAWYVSRERHSGTVLASVPERVIEEYGPFRSGFPYARYLTSFHPGLLWDTPNHELGALEPGADLRSSHANSLMTLLHSETWGDHWLSFSGAKGKDGKLWAKRVSLLTAVLVPLVMALLLAASAYGHLQRVKEWRREVFADRLQRARSFAATLEAPLVLFALCAFGAVTFLSWQLGDGLMPGYQGSIKFIYVASFVPAAIALVLSRPLERWVQTLLTAYFVVLYAAAFPVAMFWPS